MIKLKPLLERVDYYDTALLLNPSSTIWLNPKLKWVEVKTLVNMSLKQTP